MRAYVHVQSKYILKVYCMCMCIHLYVLQYMYMYMYGWWV